MADNKFNPQAEKHWYVVNTFSQRERKVEANLKTRAENLGIWGKNTTKKGEGYITRILVAEHDEQVIDKETGLPVPGKTKKKNLFPGHIFVEMVMDDYVWYVVRNTPDVTGIAGSAGGGKKPIPVSDVEMEPVLKRLNEVDESMYERYHEGVKIKINGGPFEGSEGVIKSVNKAENKCVVSLSFFGRTTDTEIEFQYIDNISESK